MPYRHVTYDRSDKEVWDHLEDCVRTAPPWRFVSMEPELQGAPMRDRWSIVIPYWSVTTPLILLAAYLILWKPRKRPTPN